MNEAIPVMIISFFIYGVSGWLWESLVFPILARHRIHNSGFLNGPIVPIYGAGAMAVILFFEPDEKIISLFLEGAVVACTIEYVTSYVMEKIYHRRWWDYSKMDFNLNGRICLGGFGVFGIFSVCCVKWIQPMLYAKLIRHDFIFLVVVAAVLSTLFVTDICYTIYQMAHIDQLVDEAYELFEEFIETMETDLSDRAHFEAALSRIKDVKPSQYAQAVKNNAYRKRRIITAFPHLLKQRSIHKNEE